MASTEETKKESVTPEGEGEMIYVANPKTGEMVSYPKEKIKHLEPGPVPPEPLIDRTDAFGERARGGINLLGKS